MTTLVLQPTKEEGKSNTIGGRMGAGGLIDYSWYPTISVGGDSWATSQYRGIIRFTGISTIPTGSIVTSALLTLYGASQASSSKTGIINIHKCLVEWWSSTGVGSYPAEDEVVSIGLYRNVATQTQWQTSTYGAGMVRGWDFEYEPTDTVTFQVLALNDFDVTADVQSWVNGETNWGWVLRESQELGYWFLQSGTWYYIGSSSWLKRFSSAAGMNPPKLTIEYTEASAPVSPDDPEVPFSPLCLENHLVTPDTTHYYNVKVDGWAIKYNKPLYTRYTMTGEVDRCGRLRDANDKKIVQWNYTFYCTRQQLENLVQDFLRKHPYDKFLLTDVDGQQYEVYIDEMTPPENISPIIVGGQSRFRVAVTMKRNT